MIFTELIYKRTIHFTRIFPKVLPNILMYEIRITIEIIVFDLSNMVSGKPAVN